MTEFIFSDKQGKELGRAEADTQFHATQLCGIREYAQVEEVKEVGVNNLIDHTEPTVLANANNPEEADGNKSFPLAAVKDGRKPVANLKDASDVVGILPEQRTRKPRKDIGQTHGKTKSPDKPKKRKVIYHLAMNDKFISFESMEELSTYISQSGFKPPIPVIKGGKIVSVNVQYVLK